MVQNDGLRSQKQGTRKLTRDEMESNLGLILKSIRRANVTKDKGLPPKIEFLTFPLMKRLGKLGRITQS